MKTFLFALSTLALTLSADADPAAGKNAYMTCMACHGADGKGMKAGTNLMAPSLAGSKLATGDAAVLIKIILKGIAKEDAKYMMVMAPLEAAYPDDQKLADVVNYVRTSFGNKASAVTADEVKKIREAAKDIKGPLKRTDLVKEEEKKK